MQGVPFVVLQQFGPYRLDELIGRGGMGEVYRAFDTGHNRLVALKLMPTALAENTDFEARFRRESQLLARLREPHIIPIHRFGEIDGKLFIDMRLVEGIDLAKLLDRSGPLPAQRCVDIVSQVADALDAAHADGLVHRDVKPSNVLLDRPDRADHRDFAYLVDFGIAYAVGGTSLTATGQAVGTAAYLAPERFEGRGDHRVDVYALGCLLYELLSGSKPFVVDGLPALIHAHLLRPPPRPSQQRADLPVELDDVVAMGMAKDPGARFASAGALAAAARSALASAPPRADLPPAAVALPAPASTGTTPVSPTVAPLVAAPARPTPQPAPTPPAPGERYAPPTGPTPRLGAAPLPDVAPPVTQDAGARRRRTRRQRVAVLATTALVVASLVVAVLVLARPPSGTGAGAATAGAPITTPAAADPPANTVLDTVKVGDGAGGVAVSPDGNHVYAVVAAQVVTATTATPGGDPTVHIAPTGTSGIAVVDAASGTVVATIPVESVNAVTVAPDGKRVYAATFGGTVAVIDTASNTVTATIEPPGLGSSLALAVTPDGTRLYVTADEKDSVVVIDTATNAVLRSIKAGDEPNGIAISPDGSRAYVPSYYGDSVSVIDTAGNTVTATIPVGGIVSGGIAITPDGRLAYVTKNDSVAVIDIASDTVAANLPLGADDVATAPDGRHVYLGSEAGLSVVDTATNTVTATVPLTANPNPARIEIAVSGDGRRAYLTNASDAMTVVALAG